MPQAIPLIVTAAATAAKATALTTAFLTLASTVAVGAYEYSRAKRQARRASRWAQERSIQDRTITLRSAVSPHTYVLGTARTGGTLMFADTIGPNRKGLDMVVALCCNPSELVAFYVNDERLLPDDFPGTKYGAVRQRVSETFGNVSGPTATLTTQQFVPIPGTVVAFVTGTLGEQLPLTVVSVNGRDVTVSGLPPVGHVNLHFETQMTVLEDSTSGAVNFRIQFKDGDPDQESTAWSSPYNNSGWTSDHRLRGITYIRTLMVWNENSFSEGIPNISAEVRGRALPGYPFYDPRDGSNPSYTDNPALLAAWWMTLPRSYGGCGIPSDWIDWNWVAAAANVCDELITVRTLDGSGYEQVKRYRCNTVLSTEDDPRTNLEIILSAMNGRHVFTAGKYRIVAGAFRAATLTITDEHVVGTEPIRFIPSASRQAPPNVVTASFADANQNYAETSPNPVRNVSYITDDGREEPLEIQLRATTDARLANYLMGVVLEQSRPAATIELRVGGIGENIAVFDCVQVNLTNRSAYASKTFEVVGITDHWDGTFTLQLAEIRPNTWALNPDTFTPIVPVPVPDMSYLWNVQPLTGFAVDIQTPTTLPNDTAVSQINITWDRPTSVYVQSGSRIEVRYAEAFGPYVSGGSVPADSTGTTISATLIEGHYYVFEARVVNALGAVSEWVSVWVKIEGQRLPVGVMGSGLFTWTNIVGATTTATSITKESGSDAWDAGAHSLQSYSTGCYASARGGQTNTAKAFGLNSDPAIDAHYTGIDFAWVLHANGTCSIYESGLLVGGAQGAFGAYTSSTVFTVKYDGEAVRYEKDGVVVRTVTGQSGRRFFLDTSLNHVGASLVDVLFGPMGGVGPAGPTGAAAQLIRLTASGQVFLANASNVITSPTSITFTASRQNIASATTWSTSPNVTLTGTGDTRTLTAANFGANNAVTVTVSAGGFSDSITVVRLRDGANGQSAIQVLLTNQAHTFAADPDGIITDFSQANGRLFLYEGQIDRTSNATLSAIVPAGVTVEINTAENTPIAGQPKGYYRVTAMNVDQAMVTLRATYNSVNYDARLSLARARAGAPGDGSNLLRVDQWQIGTTGTQGAWTSTTTPTESAIVLGGAGTAPAGPFGTSEPLWECRPSGDGESDGGWEHIIDIDHTRTYRSSVWVRFNQVSGSFYHGCSTNYTYTLAGATHTNPYFVGTTLAALGLQPNKWYLSVAYIHGSGYTGGDSGLSGIYDPETGRRIVAATEFRNAPSAPRQSHRVYHYYDTNTSTRQWMARPRFEEVNGNEPSIDELMGFVPSTPWKARGNAAASHSTFAKIPTAAAAWGDADVYSIQAYRTCHLQFKAVQVGAQLMLGLNGDPANNMSYNTIDFAWYPHAGGSQIYESGTYIGEFGAYTTNTEFAITYDGTTVRYYKDRALVRSVNAPGRTFYLDSSFYTPGSAVNAIKWGPGVEFETIGTGDIAQGAITDVPIIVHPADGDMLYPAVTQPQIENPGLNATASYTAPASGSVVVNVSWAVQARISSMTSGAASGVAVSSILVLINGSTAFYRDYPLEGFVGADNWGHFSGSRAFTVQAGQTIQVYLSTGRSFSTGGASPEQTMYWRGAFLSLIPTKR